MKKEYRNSDIFNGLNESQIEAVECTEGPVLVLAGAGSGKTRVLTHRVAHLVLNKGVSSARILAITFTNKATNEMRERLDNLLGDNHMVWISTIHSFCVSVLRSHISKLDGYELNFSIYDDSDSRKVIKKVIKEMEEEGKSVLTESVCKDAISYNKQLGHTAETYAATVLPVQNDIIAEVFLRYEKKMKESNALDFDDLLVYTYIVLDTFPKVAAHYQDRFQYIHVDEYQDTNLIQNKIVDILAAKWRNLFVVGDDDQSIYAFRGADVTNILGFDKKYKDATVIKLEKNYRSTPQILAIANNIIQNNEFRHDKTLIPVKGPGVKVEHIISLDDRREASTIVSTIMALKRNFGHQNSDFAILTRESGLIKTIEMEVNDARLDYIILGGLKLFETKEIKDVSAFLRLIANEYDSEAFLRVINLPARGIGNKTQEKIIEHARIKGISLLKAVDDIALGNAVGFGKATGIKEFAEIMQKLLGLKDSKVSELITSIMETVPLAAEYEDKDGAVVCRERLDNINHYKRMAIQAEYKSPKLTLIDWLHSTVLATDQTVEQDDSGKVTIATVHAVKGLEYKNVFIIGCEENIFPSAQALSDDDLEEERRVMYVAVTRAKERLYLSSVRGRFRYGTVQYNPISRFIIESGVGEKQESFKNFGASGREQMLEKVQNYYNPDYVDLSVSQLNEVSERQIKAVQEIKKAIHAASAEVFNESTSGYVKGAKVMHRRYGEGVILFVSGSGVELQATIDFPNFGQKVFTVRNAPLKLI
ncbi:MAG: UvrD-helicase domain-containing protein [Clostridiales bacterium]|jgi:DNA helicase-2/ATP-dependent DNA helicase PcrA|nr:UvrD-helicase domain-containing protein [Clostridiales bacterium]